MKIYADYSHYQNANRKYLVELLTALWNNLTNEQRVHTYGEWIQDCSFTDRLEDADVCILPMRWDYYIKNGLAKLAESAIEQARKASKQIIIFSGGDYTAHIPFKNVILFELSGYRSRNRSYRCYGMPPLLDDQQSLYCGGHSIYRRKSKVPVVGFCGTACVSRLDSILRAVKHRCRRTAFGLGLLRLEPPPFETSHFRTRVLNLLASRQDNCCPLYYS